MNGWKSTSWRCSLPAMAQEDHLDTGRVPAVAANHLVILVHGINTRALWMGEIKPALEKGGFLVAPTSYGRYGILRFLSPFRNSRKKAIERVVADIRTARRARKLATGSEPTHMSVISHSFGTYVVSKILTDYPEFHWQRVIFCGSVVREDFPFDQVLERFGHPLLNEIGTRDFLPALAESAGWGYGSVGSTGFNRPPVETRWHNGFRHSVFLTEAFCDKFWTPFLQGEKPKRADKAAEMPAWIRAITWFPLRLLPVALLSVALPFGILQALNTTNLLASKTDPAVEGLCKKYPAFCTTASETLSECFHGLGPCNSSVEEITIVCPKGKRCIIVN
jgi:pimeloyl-ACP methyl ester carboxylesterase